MANNENKIYIPRLPGKLESVSCIIVLFAAIAFAIHGGADISTAILIATLYIVLVGLHCGYSLRELMNAMLEKAAGLTDLYILFLGIGFLVASLVFSGAIPTLICYLLDTITPGMCIFLGFLLPAVTAFFIGTSFGTAGTIGVIMVSLGLALGANMPLLGGAVVSGSHVGLLISPLSDNFNTTASLGKADSRTTIRRALYIGAPMLAICALFYLVAGFIGGGQGSAVADTAVFNNELRALFNVTPVALLPIVYVMVVSFMKVPAI